MTAAPIDWIGAAVMLILRPAYDAASALLRR